ncbi:MAG: hypothetical protein FIB08_05010 [Candidatus Methanoperedens sp.]|nr:hypothetical protein [Candidatus Methanoperedens sp.]
MAEAVKKAVKKEKPVKPDENASKEAAKATLQALSKGDTPKDKAVAVKAPSSVQAAPKAEEKSVEAIKKAPLVKTEDVKVEATKDTSKPEARAKPEAPKAQANAEVKKEADPNKEFVDGIMTEMSLKGASKKRLIKKLGEQYNFDKQRVLFKLKRALITERYAAAHAEGGAAH